MAIASCQTNYSAYMIQSII